MKREFGTICYIFDTPVLESYRRRFCMDEFAAGGRRIAVIDVSPILNPGAYAEIRTDLLREPDYLLLRPAGKREYAQTVRELPKDTFFLFATNFGYARIFLYRPLRGRPFGYICHADMIPAAAPDAAAERVSGYFRHLTFARLMETVCHRMPRRLLPLPKADFTVMTGSGNEKALRSVLLADRKTKTVYAGGMDYRQYVNEIRRDSPPLVDGPYCVFLDEYLPYHPDREQIGLTVDPARYYGELEALFAMIREETGWDVVIAAHPRSDYAAHPEHFRGFRVFKGETCRLVRHSRLVLMHYSLAASYALLAGKPLVQLADEELQENRLFRGGLDTWAAMTGAPAMDLARPDRDFVRRLPSLRPDLAKYDEAIRENVKRDYVRGREAETFFEDLNRGIEYGGREEKT